MFAYQQHRRTSINGLVLCQDTLPKLSNFSCSKEYGNGSCCHDKIPTVLNFVTVEELRLSFI